MLSAAPDGKFPFEKHENVRSSVRWSAYIQGIRYILMGSVHCHMHKWIISK